PDLLHRSHPMIPMKWNYVPEGFDEKVQLLLEHLKNEIGYVTAKQTGFKFMRLRTNRMQNPVGMPHHYREKTIIFCNSTDTASRLGELLATTHGFRKLGLFVKKIGYDERRKRLKMFREGRITLMVSTDLLSRGIDIPDLKNVIQFDFSRNIVNHLLRSGRASRAGARGRVFCMYDDDEQGGKALAEAIQELGTQPLDGLFSRRRGFRHMLQRTEAFRQMLLIQGLPLPPHLQAGPDEPLARIGNSEALREDALQRALWDEDTESTPSELEEEEAARSTTNRQFDRARESQKDFEFNEALEAMEEEEEEMLN
ncbi:RH22, partial [Symbiodinium sp. CCMP2456]